MTDWYVDGTHGNNSNSGVAIGLPKQTIAAVLASWSAGDRLFIRRGTYTETGLNATKFVNREVHSYNGEQVFFNAGGANSFSGALDTTGATPGRVFYFFGINFIGYTGDGIHLGSLPGGTYYSEFVNCFFRGVANTGTSGIFTEQETHVRHCSFVDNAYGIIRAPGSTVTFGHSIFDGNTINYTLSNLGIEVIIFANQDYNAWTGNNETHGINTNTIPVSFNNRLALDFSLSAASGLRRVGQYGVNIGASFNAREFMSPENPFSDLADGVNDEEYYDTNLDQPGVDGPSDAGPAIGTNGVWKINNIAAPGAKSARVKFEIVLPAGAKLTIPGWSSFETETNPTGQKQVIGNTTSTRDIKISINGGPKRDVDGHTNLDINAALVTVYMTIRADGV